MPSRQKQKRKEAERGPFVDGNNPTEEEDHRWCRMMERPATEAPGEVDKARQRVLSYYRHLFPGLSQQKLDGEKAEAGTADSLEAVPTVALDPAFDLSPEAVGKGWTSQPQVRTLLLLLFRFPSTR